MYYNNLLPSLLLVSIICLLPACTGTVNVIPKLDSESTLGQNRGLVAVRLADASPWTRYPFNHITYAPKNLNEKETVKSQRAQRDDEAAITGGTFVAPLAPGQYSLSDLYAFHSINSQYYYQNFVSSTPKFGTFTVKPGELTNLGTIIYYPRFDGKDFYESLVRNDSFGEAEAHIKRKYESVYNSLQHPVEARGWDESSFEDEQWNQYVRAAQNPLVFEPAYQRSDGGVVFLSRLGVIAERSGSGDWKLDSIPMDVQLAAYDENTAGARVVGGEFGALFYKSSAGDAWTRLAPPLPGAIVRFAFIADSGAVLAGLAYERVIRVYRAESGENPEWKEMARYTESRAGWWMAEEDGSFESRRGTGTRRPPKIDNANGFRHQGQPAVHIDGEVYRFSPSLTQVEDMHVDGNLKLIESAGDHLIGFDNSWWDGSREVFVSFDDGASWTELENDIDNCETPLKAMRGRYCSTDPKIMDSSSIRLVGPPHFWDSQHGYAYAVVVHRYTDNEETLLETHDGGQSWAKVESETDLPEYCGKLVPAIGPNRLLLQCFSGHFYLSEDGGQHWRIDREPSL